jgi:hypothetical protein
MMTTPLLDLLRLPTTNCTPISDRDLFADKVQRSLQTEHNFPPDITVMIDPNQPISRPFICTTGGPKRHKSQLATPRTISLTPMFAEWICCPTQHPEAGDTAFIQEMRNRVNPPQQEKDLDFRIDIIDACIAEYLKVAKDRVAIDRAMTITPCLEPDLICHLGRWPQQLLRSLVQQALQSNRGRKQRLDNLQAPWIQRIRSDVPGQLRRLFGFEVVERLTDEVANVSRCGRLYDMLSYIVHFDRLNGSCMITQTDRLRYVLVNAKVLPLQSQCEESTSYRLIDENDPVSVKVLRFESNEIAKLALCLPPQVIDAILRAASFEDIPHITGN